MSNCPHCNRSTFEIEEVDASGAELRLRLAQYSGGKAPIGVLGNSSAEQPIHDFEQRMTEVLRVMVSSLQKMTSRLDQIERAVGK